MAAALSQAQESAPKRPRGGRNGSEPVYTEEIANEICERLATGEGLRSICQSPGMPTELAVRKWVLKRPGFGTAYTRAREMGCDSIADEIIEISDAPILHNGDPDNALVQHARLRADNRRWLLSKLVPKKYGDKVTQEITGEDGGALITRIELVPVDPRPKASGSTIEHDEGPMLPQKRRGKRSPSK